MLLRVPYADLEQREQDTRESGLEWVIARLGMLTDGPATRHYVRQSGLERVSRTWTISRANLADFLVEAAEVDTWVGKAVQLCG
ncbi:NAD(P)H-binding protein [Burkholderia aenigmatica]|uniref:NAD(P)H-binding protein n=1 Tax=Burkholderia cepacia complex TaxID=87882 RepID=UPI00158A13F8|nr:MULTISPECIES: NAD(P)H-binding protein [Burkholderia cepacia complex]UKD16781.1 NAD(P)H-binding protein [Burkholderia aenigmatica]